MGFFTKLEKLSEKYIEGFFKTRFADHIEPAEIAKLLLREMRDNKHVSVSMVYVPNEYTVFLGPQDWQTINPVQASLARELQQFLHQKARDKAYVLLGEVKVGFAGDDQLGLGSVIVRSTFSEKLPSQDKPKQPAPAFAAVSHNASSGAAGEVISGGLPAKLGGEGTIIAERVAFQGQVAAPAFEHTFPRGKTGVTVPKAVLVQKIGSRDGHKFPLGVGGAVLGRRRNNDICIEDSNISRVHASLDYTDGSYLLTDLGSTNGTFVNGHRISRKKLAQGDLIRMGSTILEFRVV